MIRRKLAILLVACLSTLPAATASLRGYGSADPATHPSKTLLQDAARRAAEKDLEARILMLQGARLSQTGGDWTLEASGKVRSDAEASWKELAPGWIETRAEVAYEEGKKPSAIIRIPVNAVYSNRLDPKNQEHRKALHRWVRQTLVEKLVFDLGKRKLLGGPSKDLEYVYFEGREDRKNLVGTLVVLPSQP